MASRVIAGEPEDGQRTGTAIPSIDQQPRELTQAQVVLGLSMHAHGAALIDRLTCEGALSADEESVWLDLTDYGIRAVRTMIDSGEIFARFRSLTRGTLRPAPYPEFDEQVRSILATDAVSLGLTSFFRRIRAGEWDPSRKASLRTYFVNGCVLEFKRFYEEWLARLQEEPLGEDHDADVPDRERNLDERVTESVDLERWMSGLPERQRVIVRLILAGQSMRTIADETGYSPESLRRIRRQWKPWWTDHLREREGND